MAPRAIRIKGNAFAIRRELRAHLGSRGTNQFRWWIVEACCGCQLNSIDIYALKALHVGQAMPRARNRGASNIIPAYWQSLRRAAGNWNSPQARRSSAIRREYDLPAIQSPGWAMKQHIIEGETSGFASHHWHNVEI